MGFQLGRLALGGGRVVSSLTPVGVAITGLVIFLEWSGVTEKYVSYPIRKKHAVKKRFDAQKKLDYSLENAGDTTLEKLLNSVRNGFFEERMIILEETLMKYYGHEKVLSEISEEFYKITQYYEWLAQG